jgi:ABC-type branched-subunit amino acid transport system substrate-binding protein
MVICSLLFAVCYLLSACAMPGDAAPVVKIGVIAPFEGAGRPLGYAILPAVKTAVAEANASGKLGRYQVAVVAFNDDLHGPTAAAQAQALALDPEVLAVVGPWSAETAGAAEPILAEAGFPLGATATSGVAIPKPGERWNDAALAQAADQADARIRAILAALADDIRLHGRPTRTGVAAVRREAADE